MANVLRGGFAGVVAAERLAEQLSEEHQIALEHAAGILFS